MRLDLSIFQAYLKDKDVTKERIYIETVEEIFSNVDKIIIDNDAGNGVVPYLPLKELNKSTEVTNHATTSFHGPCCFCWWHRSF